MAKVRLSRRISNQLKLEDTDSDGKEDKKGVCLFIQSVNF